MNFVAPYSQSSQFYSSVVDLTVDIVSIFEMYL